MSYRMRFLTIGLLLVAATSQAVVTGRYVVYGNGLSPILEVAELEVWSGDKDVVLKRPDAFTLHCITARDYDSYVRSLHALCDGRIDTLQRPPQTFQAAAAGMGYKDGALSYCALEMDLGASVPVERIELYRSRYIQNGRPFKLFQDLGWRYMIVLDEARRIVAWDAFNVYQGDYLEKKGHWSFNPKPAEGAPAGRLVPEGRRDWLSEAEYIRDFLGKPVTDTNAPPSDADRERLARFAHRDDPAEIRKLGETFFRLVDLERSGMSGVKELVEQGEYGAALEAFKAPFFRTIARVDRAYGKAEYTWHCDMNSRAGMRARDLANHVYGDKKDLTVKQFTPGLLPPAKFQMPFQMRPLLLAYAGTGDTKWLRAWEAMTDDWAMGFQDAADKDPKKLRDHFVLIGGSVMGNLMDLHNAAKDNPAFVEELSGATLARYLMPILEEMPVAIWRVCRKGVFNHVFNAVSGGWSLSQVLADFRAGQRLEREMVQLMERMYTLGLYRDGPMVEQDDEGHMQGSSASPAALYGLFAVHPDLRPKQLTPAFEAFYLDRLRRSELIGISHTSPDGTGIRESQYKRWSGLPAFGDWGRYDRLELERREYCNTTSSIAGTLQRLSVMLEPECRAVLDTVHGYGYAADALTEEQRRERINKQVADRLHRLPRTLSDWLPYAGGYYFRSSWEPTAAILHMLNPAIRNTNRRGPWNPYLGHLGHERSVDNPTIVRFRDLATPMLTMFATEIEQLKPCPFEGFYPCGSKQDAFSQAVEKPQPMRWFSDDRLDFGEAVYRGLYRNIFRDYVKNPETGERECKIWSSPDKVENVTTTRQIFQIRPARLFLQVERTQYASADETHTNRIPITLILTEPGPETGKEFSSDQLKLDEKTRTIKMRNPGNPGATLAWFGQPDMKLIPYSVNGPSDHNYFPRPGPVTVDPKRDAKLNPHPHDSKKGFPTLNGPRRTSGRGVFAEWPATGSSVLLSALLATRPGDDPIKASKDISTDVCAGLQCITKANRQLKTKETTITLLVARQTAASLTAGPVSLEGEALLLVEEQGQAPSVIALGVKALTIDGKPIELPSADVTFDLSSENSSFILNPSSLRPIHCPLDPPTIGPAANTFTDRTMVTLSTTSPDAEIRYTTDVPPSRLAEFRKAAEKVKAGTLTMVQAAERLVLLSQADQAEWKVYTGPFEISEDTFVRARTFRKGVDDVPMLRTSGDDVSMISYGFFRRHEPKPAQRRRVFKRLSPGLEYDYLEDRWFALWTHADVLPPKGSGTVTSLLDVSMRETDGPFGVRYRGFLDVPEDGVYVFYGPDEFINNTCAPGYDLRVYVDGEEWYLGQNWHGRGMWSVPLEKGLHRFMVTFADARAKDIDNQRVDLWRGYPEPATTWRGIAPVLEISGPGLARQPIPNEWLKR